MYKWILFSLICIDLSASEVVETKNFKDILVEASSQTTLNGKSLDYRIQSGILVLNDKDNKEKVGIGYTAYFLDGNHSSQDRPIAFCFNGGPGSAAIWLNTGFMGPLRTTGDDLVFQDPPFSLIPNEASLLDKMDMVFIDPVSTGHSKPAPGVDVSSMYAVEEDANVMAEFVRHFTTQSQRFDSAKYFVSESYGAIRAAKVAYKLHDEYGYYINGMIFISPALDMQTISPEGCNDLPYLLTLPTYTAIAAFHKKILGEPDVLIEEAKEFALTSYLQAIYKGDQIDPKEKNFIVENLSRLTGLSKELINRLNMRIPVWRFTKNLLLDEGKIVGRFDGRVSGQESKEFEFGSYDPSIDAIIGAVTATFSQYLIKELKWPNQEDYHVLTSIPSWNWGKGNQYVSALKDLKCLMHQNPRLKVVVMSGLYDLATPVAAVQYAIDHLGLNAENQARIHKFLYPAGHMMYYKASIRKEMKKDLVKLLFID